MKFINWIVRFKHPVFWTGLVALFFATIGVEASSLTSWPLLVECLKDFISNPFAIGCVIVALIGYVTDFTTKGIGDTKLALSYTKPKDAADSENDYEIIRAIKEDGYAAFVGEDDEDGKDI